ncbi:MAG: hypothetical protein FADNKDHG_01587 [Holosporales bacterium]
MPIVIAITAVSHMQAQENINDLFNDQKTILEGKIGSYYFNKPIFKKIKNIHETYAFIHEFLPLELFQKVINFELNQPIRHLLQKSYENIVLNYDDGDHTALEKLGENIEIFHETHYNYHFMHNFQRMMSIFKR